MGALSASKTLVDGRTPDIAPGLGKTKKAIAAACDFDGETQRRKQEIVLKRAGYSAIQSREVRHAAEIFPSRRMVGHLRT
jgi:hypothetical protein